MNGEKGPALRAWLALWRSSAIYHRYTVEGLEHLVGDTARPSLVVGYHGRGYSSAMCMLSVALYDRLGRLPCGVIHRGVDRIPPLAWLRRELGFVTTDDASVAAAVQGGQHILVTPGGAWEACRSFRNRYRVDWDGRMGYLRLALQHGLPIVPVGAAGSDDTYIGINEASELGRRLRLPRDWRWLPWLGVGPVGIFPFSPPFPVRIRQLVGPPIDPQAYGPVDADDPAGMERLHRLVSDSVQGLLDRARAAVPDATTAKR